MFYDLVGNPLSAFIGETLPEEVHLFTFKVDCKEDRRLYCDVTDDLLIEARIQGDVAWVNLETGEIDLTPYAGLRKTFEMRMTAVLNFTASQRRFDLIVGV